jgi:hypothetical protein
MFFMCSFPRVDGERHICIKSVSYDLFIKLESKPSNPL